MKWRVIPFAEYSAFRNMAVDEAVSESVRNGGPPTIRFYGWNPSAVSVGYFQSMEKEVNVRNCRESGVDMVRRRTGGGAVYHDNKGEITYSVIGKLELFPRDIIASYRLICGWICDSLNLLGIRSEFKPINDIVVNGRKISGNAQTRREGALLQHGTIIYDVDVGRMFSLLNVPDEKIKDKMIATVRERVTSVRQQKNVVKEHAYWALMKGFTTGKEHFTGPLTEEEEARAETIEEERYRKKSWNHMR
ncbi:lipoate--protein ligase family protein [Candidatus Micrarchaeota archaeon]|nr:lipoate--protein ligase family protein [Candidatus Micrarchaeota archaeon]